MVRAGVPESVAQRVSGHATAAIFRRYDITSAQDLRDARDRRAQFGHNQAAKVVSNRAVSCCNHDTEASRNPVGLPDFKSGVRL